MRFILLVALLGCAVAYPLTDADLSIQYAKSVAKYDEDAAVESLQNTLTGLLKEVKDKLDRGFEVGNKLLDKVEEVCALLKEMKADFGVKAKELFTKIKNSYTNFFTNAFKNLFGWGKKDQRGLSDWWENLQKLRETLKNILTMINDKIDVEQISAYIKEKFGEDTLLGKLLLSTVTKGLDKLKELINKLIGVVEQAPLLARGSGRGMWDIVEDLYNQLKELLQKFKQELFSKYGAFSKWIKENWDLAMEEGKTISEKVRRIAIVFLEKAKDMDAETKKRALEFFSMFKEELGDLYDEIVKIAKA